jgi:hypothetical protein
VDDKNHNPNPAHAGGQDDYLWDRSGPADPDIQKLELLLEEFRHDSPVPAFTDIVPEKRESFFSRLRFVPVLAGATAALLILFATIFLLRSAHFMTRTCTTITTRLVGTFPPSRARLVSERTP